MSGPYDSEAHALAEPLPRAVAELHASGRVRSGDPDHLVCSLQAEALLRACHDAGVQVGVFDGRIIDWLAGWEPATVQVVISWLGQAFEAGRSSR